MSIKLDRCQSDIEKTELYEFVQTKIAGVKAVLDHVFLVQPKDLQNSQYLISGDSAPMGNNDTR